MVVKDLPSDSQDISALHEDETPSHFARARNWLKRLWEPKLSLALAAGIGIRLILLPWFNDPYNFYGMYVATDLLQLGFDPLQIFAADPRFGELNPWGYPSLYFVFTSLAYGASLGDSFLFGIWLRIPSVIFDAGTTILIFRIALRVGGSDRAARIAALAFLFNPFSILITSVWGVNDPIPVFFTTLATFFVVRNGKRDLHLAGWAVGMGAALKLYPLLLIPVVLARTKDWGKRLGFLGIAASIPLITSLPFLLGDARSYLGNLLGFASGAEETALDPQFTILQGISLLTGPLPPSIAIVSAAVMVLGLYWIYRKVDRSGLSAVTASALVVLLAYMLAVRWIANYMLWAMPFVILHAVLFAKGWKKWVVGAFWLPAMVYAVLYIGWYPDPFSGASGLSYWGLVSGAPQIRFHELLPQETPAGIIGALVFLTVVSIYCMVRPLDRRLNDTRPRADRVRVAKVSDRRRHILALLIILVFTGGLVVSTIVQASARQPVAPRDFSSFQPSQNGIAMHDDFGARFLSFRWTFQGTGVYSLQPDGTPGIRIDTLNSSYAAFIRDELSADSLWLNLTFQVRRLYGNGTLVLASGPGGWIGVESNESRGLILLYRDDLANQTYDVGTILRGFNSLSLHYSSDERRLTTAGRVLVLPPAASIGSIEIGHTLVTADGGGELVVKEITMVWSRKGGLSHGPPVWSVVGAALLGVATVAPIGIPGVWRRISRGR